MPQPDSLQDTALEHLRVIRTLMERAHIYRSVSAPAALIGGILSLAVGLHGFRQNVFFKDMPAVGNSFRNHEMLLAWIGVLVVTGMINLILLTRGAHQKGQPVITAGLSTALRGLVPPMLTGGVLGGCLIWFDENIVIGAITWILCYGLALQATVNFAPRSIIWLARAFIITGQSLVIVYFAMNGLGMFQRKEAPASLFLALTFGLYHVIYAAAVFFSNPEPTSEQSVCETP